MDTRSLALRARFGGLKIFYSRIATQWFAHMFRGAHALGGLVCMEAVLASEWLQDMATVVILLICQDVLPHLRGNLRSKVKYDSTCLATQKPHTPLTNDINHTHHTLSYQRPHPLPHPLTVASSAECSTLAPTHPLLVTTRLTHLSNHRLWMVP